MRKNCKTSKFLKYTCLFSFTQSHVYPIINPAPFIMLQNNWLLPSLSWILAFTLSMVSLGSTWESRVNCFIRTGQQIIQKIFCKKCPSKKPRPENTWNENLFIHHWNNLKLKIEYDSEIFYQLPQEWWSCLSESSQRSALWVLVAEENISNKLTLTKVFFIT